MKAIEKITVIVLQPSNAHLMIPANEKWQTHSEHTCTWRGLRNAIRAAAEAREEYKKSHGGMAAQGTEIVCLGKRAGIDYWIGFSGRSTWWEPCKPFDLSLAAIKKYDQFLTELYAQWDNEAKTASERGTIDMLTEQYMNEHQMSYFADKNKRRQEIRQRVEQIKTILEANYPGMAIDLDYVTLAVQSYYPWS